MNICCTPHAAVLNVVLRWRRLYADDYSSALFDEDEAYDYFSISFSRLICASAMPSSAARYRFAHEFRRLLRRYRSPLCRVAQNHVTLMSARRSPATYCVVGNKILPVGRTTDGGGSYCGSFVTALIIGEFLFLRMLIISTWTVFYFHASQVRLPLFSIFRKERRRREYAPATCRPPEEERS